MRWFDRLFRKTADERQLDSELRFDLEQRIAEQIAGGVSPGEARRRARIEFGGMEAVKEDCREARRVHIIETLIQDVRYGARVLRKNPGFAVVAVLTLALGIGANTAIFSVVQAVLLAPLPYRQPDRLVLIALYNSRLQSNTNLSYPDFLDWQRDARSFESLAAFTFSDYNLTSPGTPEYVEGREVSAGFFGVLGVQLAAGRDFSTQEDRLGGPSAAIISDRLWRSRFGGSARVLGRFLTLDGVDYTIVGILPPDFSFGNHNADVFTPVGRGDPLLMNDRTIHNIDCLGRLKSGVSISQAHAEMDAIQEQIDQLYPAAERGLETAVLPLEQEMVGDVKGTLLLVLGAVGFVLLVACTNVANLLLARSASRAREFAIRAALGAGRWRVARQLLTESVVLSLAGAALGLLLAKWGLRPVLAAVPKTLPRSQGIGINVPVLLFTFGVAVGVGIVFGLGPALKGARTDLQTSLKAGGRGATGSRQRAQSSLVIAQMALTLMLLAGAGLLFRTVRNLWQVNPGFDARHLITFKVGLSPRPTSTSANVRVAYQQLVERIREIPGVEAADLTALVPLGQQENSGPFVVRSQTPRSIAEAPRAVFFWIGPDYFQMMRIPLLRGRFFIAEDTTRSVPVIIIDSVLARAYFPKADPVGQTMNIPHWGDVQIIGVVGHVRHYGLDEASAWTQNQIYASLYQLPDAWVPLFYTDVTVVVRTPLVAETLLPEIRKAAYTAAGEQAIYSVRAMQEVMTESMSAQRFPMILLGGFAALALLLASVGIYGVISYSVAQRAQEIGIRIALGATKRNVFRIVMGSGLRLALAGLVIGTAAALILSRALISFSHLLYGVRADDPLTFAAVSLVLTGVAVLACYIPARRATKVDPMVALRHE